MAYKKTTKRRYAVLGAYNGINNFDLVEVKDDVIEAQTLLDTLQKNDPEITFKVVSYSAKVCKQCEQFMDTILTLDGVEKAPWERTTAKEDNIALWRCPTGHEKVKAEKE